jgi:hypothetical protein
VTYTIADVLEDAADHIERHGWQQGAYGTAGAPTCLRGAVRAVQVGLLGRAGCEQESDVLAYAATAIGPDIGWTMVATGDPYVDAVLIPSWNDRDGRTQQEVLDVLRKAAKLARQDAENPAP